MGLTEGSPTTMVRLCLLLCFIKIAQGLQVEDEQREKLEKVLDDRVQNTELDGDNIDFPAWSSAGENGSDEKDLDSHDESEEVKDKDDGSTGSDKISDLIKNYLTTNHFINHKEKKKNRWSFMKNFFLPHINQKNSWADNFGHHSQMHSLGFGNHWGNLRDIFQPHPPPPQNNWWNEMFSNSRIDSPATEDSMITFYHSMTVDNETREGVAKVPSAQLMPLMRNVWNSLSSDSHMALGLGAFLPFIGLALPLMISAMVIPIVVLVMVSVFGLMSGALVLLPLLLTGLLGQGALPVDRMIEQFFLEEFDGADILETILNHLEEETTKEDPIEESTDKAVDEIEIPRFLGF